MLEAELKKRIHYHVCVSVSNLSEQVLDLACPLLSTRVVGQGLILHQQEFVVVWGDLSIKVQLKLTDEALLHQAKERLEFLIFGFGLLLLFGLWLSNVHFLLFLKDIDR